MDIQKFCSHMQAEGFLLDPVRVKADGRWHNVRLVDNAPGKSAGAYKILNDYVAFYKNWRTGECKSFSDNTFVNKHGKETLYKLMKQQEFELKQQYFKASKLAYEKYLSIEYNPQATSDYLIKKQVGNYGCKIDDSGNLIIPFYNEKGYLRTLQTIKPDGYKIFAKDAEFKGNYHKINFGLVDKVQSEYFGKIFIGEGYATMASVYEAIKYPCVVAANAGNMKIVLEKLTTLYPKAQFIICADNDLYLRETVKGSGKWIWDNPGIDAAVECEQIFNCKIIIPDFSGIKDIDSDINKLTDFNDLHRALGLDTVKKQIFETLALYKAQALKQSDKQRYSSEQHISFAHR